MYLPISSFCRTWVISCPLSRVPSYKYCLWSRLHCVDIICWRSFDTVWFVVLCSSVSWFTFMVCTPYFHTFSLIVTLVSWFVALQGFHSLVSLAMEQTMRYVGNVIYLWWVLLIFMLLEHHSQSYASWTWYHYQKFQAW